MMRSTLRLKESVATDNAESVALHFDRRLQFSADESIAYPTVERHGACDIVA